MAENQFDKLAGSHQVSLNGRTQLHVQRLPVVAAVEADGSYRVYAGVDVVASGQLWKGIDSDTMIKHFVNDALAWSFYMDQDRAERARIDREAAEQHMAETDEGPDAIELVQALGGRFRIQSPSRPFFIDNAAMVAVLANAARYGVAVDILSDSFDDHMVIQLNDGKGKVYGEYHYDGR